MLVRKIDEVPKKPVETEGAVGVEIQVLISPEQGAPTFVLRRFEIAPGGHTPYHKHDWEHEVFVLAGKGGLVGESGETPLEADKSVFVAPNEMHNFKNNGDTPFVFLCIVPLSGG